MGKQSQVTFLGETRNTGEIVVLDSEEIAAQYFRMITEEADAMGVTPAMQQKKNGASQSAQQQTGNTGTRTSEPIGENHSRPRWVDYVAEKYD